MGEMIRIEGIEVALHCPKCGLSIGFDSDKLDAHPLNCFMCPNPACRAELFSEEESDNG
jgi:hypothetical protein